MKAVVTIFTHCEGCLDHSSFWHWGLKGCMLGSSLSRLKHPAAEVPSVSSSVVKWLLDGPKCGSLKPAGHPAVVAICSTDSSAVQPFTCVLTLLFVWKERTISEVTNCIWPSGEASGAHGLPAGEEEWRLLHSWSGADGQQPEPAGLPVSRKNPAPSGVWRRYTL